MAATRALIVLSAALTLCAAGADFEVYTPIRQEIGRHFYYLAKDIENEDILYSADTSADGNCLRRIDLLTGVVTVFVGVCGRANDEGVLFHKPRGLCQAPNGDLIVIDSGNAVLKRVTQSDSVTIFAGVPGAFGDKDGAPSEATFDNGSLDIVCLKNGSVLLSDTTRGIIRSVACTKDCHSTSPSARRGMDKDSEKCSSRCPAVWLVMAAVVVAIAACVAYFKLDCRDYLERKLQKAKERYGAISPQGQVDRCFLPDDKAKRAMEDIDVVTALLEPASSVTSEDTEASGASIGRTISAKPVDGTCYLQGIPEEEDTFHGFKTVAVLSAGASRGDGLEGVHLENGDYPARRW